MSLYLNRAAVSRDEAESHLNEARIEWERERDDLLAELADLRPLRELREAIENLIIKQDRIEFRPGPGPAILTIGPVTVQGVGAEELLRALKTAAERVTGENE